MHKFIRGNFTNREGIKRFIQLFISIVLIIFLSLIIIIGSWTAWERNQDNLSVLNKESGIIETILNKNMSKDYLPKNREYRHIILSTEHIGDIEAFLSLPSSINSKKIPVVVLMGGLNIGIRNLKLIPELGDIALVVYQYPYNREQWNNHSVFTKISLARKKILSVPSQILGLVNWINRQPWSDDEHIVILGYSFGAFFVPAIYHLDNVRDQQLGPGVISFGGVDISLLLENNLRNIPPPWKGLCAWLAETAIYPIEPALHLPEMKNEFLLVNGAMDNQIPTESWEKMHQLVPEPKTVIILEDGHLNPENSKLTLRLINITKKWLNHRNIISYDAEVDTPVVLN